MVGTATSAKRAALLASLAGVAGLAAAVACGTSGSKTGQLLADGGHVLPDHCGDGQKDSDESDVDCGGSACSPCSGNKSCRSSRDCASLICQAGDTCTFISASDGVKNGSETDVDCGGDPGDPRCGNGKDCLAASDCVSGVCGTDKTCSAPTATDGVKNGNESDIDCGGSGASRGAGTAGTGSDAGAATDGGREAGASAVDSGAAASVTSDGAPACALGRTCRTDGDCATVACSPATSTCVPASAMDGFTDGTETDVDCGGTGGAPPCPSGDACLVATDCSSAVCTADVCKTATSSDGVKNEGETDIDCGGPSAPSCEAGKACLAHSDCSSDGCDDSGHCALAPSCTQAHGGYSCGAGETGDPAAVHDSCCTALPVTGYPGGDFLLDKYVITAGRMRQFVDRNQGNIRAWVQAHYPPGWDPTWDSWLPDAYNDTSTDSFGGVYTELGPLTYGTSGGGNQGCFVTGPGARTYRLPDSVNMMYINSLGQQDLQQYTQDVDDEKAINCVNVMMLMAFCAWDGGRLASNAELEYAWHGGDSTRTYPYGTAPNPGGYAIAYPDRVTAQQHQAYPDASDDVTIVSFQYNYWNPSEQSQEDYSVFIPAPGRFTRDVGPFGHFDLAGLAMEMTTTLTGTAGQSPATRMTQWSASGSWEVHDIGTVFNPFPMTNKYLAATGRCSR